MSSVSGSNGNRKHNVSATKPKLRGASHLVAAVATIFAGTWLALAAKTGDASRASLVFTGSLFVLFSISGLYHSVTWSPEIRRWLRRADHAAIFVLIAGTYTPICLLALEKELGRKLLLLVWTGTGLGIGQSLFGVQMPKAVTACLYLALGWVAARYRDEILEATGLEVGLLVMAGGILYSLGAFNYMLQWPDPIPSVFGYHEVFHIFVILAASAHFAAVAQLVLNSR